MLDVAHKLWDILIRDVLSVFQRDKMLLSFLVFKFACWWRLDEEHFLYDLIIERMIDVDRMTLWQEDTLRTFIIVDFFHPSNYTSSSYSWYLQWVAMQLGISQVWFLMGLSGDSVWFKRREILVMVFWCGLGLGLLERWINGARDFYWRSLPNRR